MITDERSAVATITGKYRELVCPTCNGPLDDKGFGFVSCEKCDAIMLKSSGVWVDKAYSIV